MSAITIRPAHREDHLELIQLAALDSARPLSGDVTVVEVDGRIVAAYAGGRSIADPFEMTGGMVELLTAHAASRGERTPQRHRGLQRPALRLAA